MEQTPTRVRVLGSLEVEVLGTVAPLPGARQQALLALLVVHLGEVVSATRIADVLWGEDLPADPANAVQTTVSRLRRLLGAEAISTEPPGYRLRLGREQVDAARFEDLCLRARGETDPVAATAIAAEAIGLWRGRPYGDQADGFAMPSAVRLEELRTSTLELLAELSVIRGELDDAVSRARELHAEHPLRDGPVAVLMRALHGLGRTAESLESFRRHRAVLDEELGLTPSATLSELEAAILRDEPSASPPRAESAARSGLPSTSAPTARAPSAASAATLPWRPSDLWGRDTELAETWRLLTSAPVLSLVGPGGVGKTRLALEVGHRAQAAGTATWWVDLVAVPAAGVIGKIADATGLELARLDDPVGALAEGLGPRDGLLCLDNAEHVLDELAVVVERIASHAPALRILVTSRERLGVDSETTVVLPPLEVEGPSAASSPAARLFVSRWWREAGQPSADRLATVDLLCRELDGLPLAIELAAAQSRVLGLEAVAERLASRLDLLVGGRRTAADRHRSLRAVVDWSVRHLDPAEGALLSRLGVFPGRFTLAQAEDVCGRPGAPTATLLSRLVEKSLVQAGPTGFWLLETIRTHALERLGEEDRRLVAGRHARDTLSRLQTQAARLWSPEEGEASEVLAGMGKDLAAAWRFALEHDQEIALGLALDATSYAYHRQRLDILRWSRVLLERVPSLNTVPELLAAAAASSWSAGELEPALRLARRGIEVAGGPDRPRAAAALDVCADIEMFHGRLDEATRLYRAGGALAVHPVEALLFETAATQASSYGPRWVENGDRVEALIERAHRLAIPSAVAFACFAAGETWVHADLDRARSAFHRAAEVAEGAGSTLFAMIARGQLLSEGTVVDPIPQVAADLLDHLDRWQRLDNATGVWSTLRDAVVLLTRAERWAAAATLERTVTAHADHTWRLPRLVARLEESRSVLRERHQPAPDELQPETALDRSAAVRAAREALADLIGGETDDRSTDSTVPEG